MIHGFRAEYGNTRLRPLEEVDIEKLREWRNNKEQSRFLRDIGYITSEMQIKWFRSYQETPDELIFAIEETDELKRMVGSVALYNFRGNIAEAGKIQIGDPDAHGRGIGHKSMVLAMWIAFERLGITKVTASVNPENIAAYHTYMKMGFQLEGSHSFGDNGIEYEIEISKKMLSERNPFVKDILLG